jgi:ubiquinone/menaquinone biosynthesis C-methylase UbiE
MDRKQRLTLLRAGDSRPGEVWADLGCGEGAFTLLLAEELGSGGRVLAIDRDVGAIDKLRLALSRNRRGSMASVDLRVEELAGLQNVPPLDGALIANALHYLPEPASVLRTVRRALRPGGRILVIEYDRSDSNRWVPHPVPLKALPQLALDAGLEPFEVRARVPSDFGRMIYAAVSRAEDQSRF